MSHATPRPWFGANATMAAWLYRNEGHRVNKAITFNLGNTGMCFATSVLIVF